MASVLGDHRRDTQNSHHQEDAEENDCNRKDRHTALLSALCLVYELVSVMPVTSGCEVSGSAGVGDSLMNGEKVQRSLRCFRRRALDDLAQTFKL